MWSYPKRSNPISESDSSSSEDSFFSSAAGAASPAAAAPPAGGATRWNRGEETHTFGDDVFNVFTVQFGEDFVEFVGFDVSANGFEDLGDLVFAWGRAGLGGEKVSSNVFHFDVFVVVGSFLKNLKA